ncbi:hypothetical protein [Sphingobacterium sp. LRF_L2]|uniref:hypothetical protein n=1 Tax=Sphingobacterium sp. LRF_L2 TaxID=3369421 RepID=UPI003F6194D0
MGKFFVWFWIVFCLYFIFAHPAIIYYAGAPENDYLAAVDPVVALTYLGISFTLWTIVFVLSFWIILKYTVFLKRNRKKLMEEGRRLKGEIIEEKILRSSRKGPSLKKIILAINNLQGEAITHTFTFTDTKPDDRRYEKGKICYLRVDDSFKKMPFVVLEGSYGKIRWSFFLWWILFLAAVISYFLFAYATENSGFGWRFLTFWHPLIIIPCCILFFSGLIFTVFKFLVFKKMNIRSQDKLKFNGKKTTATILDVQQTGTYINDQPELRFTIQFFDYMGEKVLTKIDKIILLIDIARVQTEKEKDVFYDPSNPRDVAFADDMIKI